MDIYCCGCEEKVNARLTDGSECYPHRKDLHSLPFWKCDTCNNFVGCHHKQKNNPTQPLGIIATPEVKKARIYIHSLIDPLWKKGLMPRGVIYSKLSKALGWKYHTSKIRTIEEARKVYREAKKIKASITSA